MVYLLLTQLNVYYDHYGETGNKFTNQSLSEWFKVHLFQGVILPCG